MAVGGRLHSLLLAPTWELENVANTTFHQGNINLNIVIRIALSHRYLRKGEGYEEEAAIELAKATISNAASIQSEVISPILDLHMPPGLNNWPYQEIRVLLALGNRYRNIGYPDYAEKQCYGKAGHIISTLPHPRKAKSLHALRRRELSVRQRCASSDEAKELIAHAKDDADPYGLRTTLHYIGWDNFRNNEYAQAEGNFHAMLYDQELGANVSWWHKMAGWLGLGAALYVDTLRDPGKFEKALCYCLKAEYVSAMLGLRVDVTRGINRLLLGRGKLLSTSAMVKKIGKEQKVSREKMQELRHTALIESGLRKELLAELSGASWAL
jgi:hypothetical protein